MAAISGVAAEGNEADVFVARGPPPHVGGYVQSLEQMISHTQCVGNDRERRVHCAAGNEKKLPSTT